MVRIVPRTCGLLLCFMSTVFGQTVGDVSALIRNVTQYGPTNFAELRTGPGFTGDDGNTNWMISAANLKNFSFPGATCSIFFTAKKSEYDYQCSFDDVKTNAQLRAKINVLKAGTAANSGWILNSPEKITRPVVDMFKASHPQWPSGQLIVVGVSTERSQVVSLMISTVHHDPQNTVIAVAPEESNAITIGQYAHMTAAQKRAVVEACVKHAKSILNEEPPKTPRDILDKRQMQSWVMANFDPDPSNPGQDPIGYYLFEHNAMATASIKTSEQGQAVDNTGSKVFSVEFDFFSKLFMEYKKQHPELDSETSVQQIFAMRKAAYDEYVGEKKLDSFREYMKKQGPMSDPK